MQTKIWLPLVGAVFLSGCATSNPFSNIPVEDRTGRPADAAPAPAPGGVVVTPVEPVSGVSVQSIELTPIVRAQREEFQPPPSEPPQLAPSMTRLPGDTQRDEPSQISSTEMESIDNAAVVALLESARVESEGGDLRAAQTRLERALRIAPRDPQVYYQLADIKRQLGQFLDAEHVALRGVEVAEGRNAELRRLWVLLTQIRMEAGDLAGADDARNQAARY